MSHACGLTLPVLAGLLACGLASAVARAAEPAPPEANPCPLAAGPVHTVTKVVDAETIVLDDGSEVRLLGLLAPRPPLSAEAQARWPQEMEAAEALGRLVLGRTVELRFSGRRSDRYDRLLAQVFLKRGEELLWVQGSMLAEGHARAYVLPGSVACAEGMLAIERKARQAGIGLWASAAFAVRSAWRTAELMRLRSTYQIVEGRIANVAEVKGAVYLNFGPDWRRDFTAGITRRSLAALAGWAGRLKKLEGKRVRIRGWIERRNGPFIEIVHPAQIEVEDQDGNPEAAGGAPAGGQSGEPDDAAPARRTQERPEPRAPGALDL